MQLARPYCFFLHRFWLLLLVCPLACGSDIGPGGQTTDDVVDVGTGVDGVTDDAVDTVDSMQDGQADGETLGSDTGDDVCEGCNGDVGGIDGFGDVVDADGGVEDAADVPDVPDVPDDTLESDVDGGVSESLLSATYGGDRSEVVLGLVTTATGGFVAVGSAELNAVGKTALLVVRVEPETAEPVVFQFEQSGSAVGKAVILLPNGNAVIAGHTIGQAGAVPWMMSLKPNGDVAWQHTLDGPLDSAVTAVGTAEGGVWVAGSTSGDQSDGVWVFVDSAGVVNQAYALGLPGRDRINGSAGGVGAKGLEGGAVFVGEMAQVDPPELCPITHCTDGWIVVIDAVGKVVWQRRIGGLPSVKLNAAAVTPDGGIVAVGEGLHGGSATTDIVVLRINNKGELVWARSVGVAQNDQAADVEIEPGGNYWVVGRVGMGDGGGAAYATSVTPEGDWAWQRMYSASLGAGATAVGVSKAGTPVIGGFTHPFPKLAPTLDVWFLKPGVDGGLPVACPAGLGTSVGSVPTSVTLTNDLVVGEIEVITIKTTPTKVLPYNPGLLWTVHCSE